MCVIKFSIRDVGEEKVFLNPISSWLSLKIRKDRLIGEKAYRFIQQNFYMTEDPSQGNEDQKKWLNLRVLILGLMKSRKLWENVIGQKDMN